MSLAEGESLADDREPDAARVAGHCIVCNRMVVRRADGSCPAGHVPAAVSGEIELAQGEDLPGFPSFNWGAFLLPPIWGMAHGLWAGVFFLPLWLFVDSIFKAAIGRPLWIQALAWLTVALTLGFQYEYGRTADRLAWRKASERMTLAEYLGLERRWAIGGMAGLLLLAAWIAAYSAR